MRISDWSSDVCSSDLVDALGPALDHLGHLARPAREVKAQAQRVKMGEVRDRQLARRVLPDAFEHHVAQVIEQYPGTESTGIGDNQPDHERDPFLHALRPPVTRRALEANHPTLLARPPDALIHRQSVT